MAITTWTNGLSSSTGPAYVGYKPAWVSGSVFWVHSSGSNSNSGLLEEKPKATLAGALDACGTNTADTIIIKSGHTETVTAEQSFTNRAGLTIVGLGTGENRPRFTVGGAVDFLAIEVTNVRIENIFFPASTAAATARIKVSAAGCVIKDCYFQCGTQDTSDTVFLVTGADYCRVEGCTFISTGTTTNQPARAVFSNDALLGVVVEDCIFDGGSAGWSDHAMLHVGGEAEPLQYFRLLNNTFTGYADMAITTTGGKGTIAGVTQSGVGSVVWVP
jgi:hypothetical protein